MAGNRRRAHDPPPPTPVGWLARLWVLGAAAVVLVVVVTAVGGPGDLGPLGRLFVWGSTAAFSLWLLREHRTRLPRPQRLALFAVCAVALVLLGLVLVVSAR